jgi:pimeloyl-ACP methyl ester carboxylesterase
MQTHHLPVQIPFGEGSEALWSLTPTGNAILFVHGFGGSATTTWIQFPTLLQQVAACRGYDFLFFGYDGLTIRARPSADLLVRFLDALFDDPVDVVKQSLPSANRTKKFKYKKILVVGHSLGAVVSRLAVVDAHRKKRRWVPKIELMFFAPAHGGASILPLASLMMGALRLAPIEALARFKYQVLHDLERKSQTLTQLEAQTSTAIKRGARNLIARRIVYAGNDKIVDPVDFCDDPAAEFIHRVTHTGVCKPRVDFNDPLHHVLACL